MRILLDVARIANHVATFSSKLDRINVYFGKIMVSRKFRWFK